MYIADLEISAWLACLGAIVLSTLFMLLVKGVILRRVQRWVDRTTFRFDTLVLASIRFPLNLLILVINLELLRQCMLYFGIDVAGFEPWFRSGAKILLILAIIYFVDSFVTGVISTHADNTHLKNSQIILKGVTRGAVYVIGGLIILSTLNIPVTPVIASLGIGSLAVALALQPTLENFFSGVQLVMDKPIRVGDFIELESGEQGFVEKIGWRSTWIRMLPNNTVIMPNSVLSQSRIINYYYPEKELSVPVEVGVHYSSDLDHVERVTLEVAREILRSHKWGVDDYDTFVLFHTFDNSSINFTVMLRAREYFNRFWVKSAFIKALHKRYNEEGIVIPFPISALNLSQEQADRVLGAASSGPDDG